MDFSDQARNNPLRRNSREDLLRSVKQVWTQWFLAVRADIVGLLIGASARPISEEELRSARLEVQVMEWGDDIPF